MFRVVSKIVLISLFAISVASFFTRPLSAQTPPTDASIPQGYDPLEEESTSIKEKVNEQTNDFLSTIRTVVPAGYNPAFDARMIRFLDEYRAYLIDYFKAIDAMEPVTGSHAIGFVDDILKEKLGFTVRDLNKKAERLYSVFNYSLIPVIKVKVEQDISNKSTQINFKEKYKGLNLSDIVKQIENKLTEQDKTYIKYKDKILKNSQIKLSRKARSYVNEIGDDDGTSEVNTKNMWGFLIAEEAWQYGLQDLEIKRMEAEQSFLQEQRELIKGFSKVEYQNTTEEERLRLIEGSKAYLSLLETQSEQVHRQIKTVMSKRTMLLGHAGSALTMYAAITIKDLFNVATQGRFLEEKYKTMYVDKKGKKYTYGQFWDETLTKYVDFRHEDFYRTHIPFASFIVAAEGTRMIIPSSLVNKFYGLFDNTVYGYGGKLMRGMIGYPISTFITMGVGMQVSQIVGQAILLRHERSLEYPELKDINNTKENIKIVKDNIETIEIREIITDIMKENSESKGALLSTAKAGTSFVISGMIWDVIKTVPTYYLKMRELNKTKCKYSYSDIIEAIQRDKKNIKGFNAVKKSRLSRVLLNIGDQTVVFIGAQFVENYMLGNMFQGSLADHEAKLNWYYSRLLKVEQDLLTKKIIATEGDPVKLQQVYDDIGGLLYIEKIVDGLRNENKNIKLCFNYTDKELTNCLESMYLKEINPESIEWKQYVSPSKYFSDPKAKKQFNENTAKSPSGKAYPQQLGILANGNATYSQESLMEDVQKQIMLHIKSADTLKLPEQLDFFFKLKREKNSKLYTESNNASESQRIYSLITSELRGLNTMGYSEAFDRLTNLLEKVIPDVIGNTDDYGVSDVYASLNTEVIKTLASVMIKRMEHTCGEDKGKLIQDLKDFKGNMSWHSELSNRCRALIIDIINEYLNKKDTE